LLQPNKIDIRTFECIWILHHGTRVPESSLLAFLAGEISEPANLLLAKKPVADQRENVRMKIPPLQRGEFSR
jgi:hypothetical protein